MHLKRILRFFGLRSRHAGGRRAHLSLRMARVFHRHSSRRSTVDSIGAPTPCARRNAPQPTTCDAAPSRMAIPENKPVALDWGTSSSASMDLRKPSPLTQQDDLDRRLVVQRLIIEELQAQARRGTAALDSHMSMIEQAQMLMDTRGADVLALPPASHDGAATQPLTRREEKQLRKFVARAVRAEAKQQQKLAKLNRQRAKQYARAQQFFAQRMTATDVLGTSSYDNRSALSDSYYALDAANAKQQRQRADSTVSSRLGSNNTNVSARSRSRSKPPRMDFLFFGGSADGDTDDLNDLEVGRRRYFRRRSSIGLRGGSTGHTSVVSGTYDAGQIPIPIHATLVHDMPRPFAPRLTHRDGFV